MGQPVHVEGCECDPYKEGDDALKGIYCCKFRFENSVRNEATEKYNLFVYHLRDDKEYVELYWDPPPADRERLELAYAAAYMASACCCDPARGDGGGCCMLRMDAEADAEAQCVENQAFDMPCNNILCEICHEIHRKK